MRFGGLPRECGGPSQESSMLMLFIGFMVGGTFGILMASLCMMAKDN